MPTINITPNQIMPAELAKIIARNSRFDGFQMMADEAPAGEPQTPPAIPTPADLTGAIAQQDKQPEPKADDKPDEGDDDYKAAGGKAKLIDDLAKERGKRQTLEAKVDQLTKGLAEALGIKPDDAKQATPEQLTEQLTAAQSEAAQLKMQLSVLSVAPEGVDAKALLDSRAFTDSLASVDATQPDAIKQAIGAFVDANPRFKQRTGTTGDLYEGRQGYRPEPAAGVPALRDAVERELNRK